MKAEITYRNIFKRTAMLGGVQVITMLLNIVRGKVVALMLGAAGLGIMSLYTMVTNIVVQFTGLGLGVSGVREIAATAGNADGDAPATRQSSVKVAVMRRINLMAAAVGMAFMLASARWLSVITFGDDSYRYGFMALGVLIFANTLTVCENAVLQGFQRLRSIALCNVTSAALGIVVGVPFYVALGQRGIVPALVLSSVLFFCITRWQSARIRLVALPPLRWGDCWREGRLMLSIGLSITVGYVLGSVANYVISGGVRWIGNIADVGLFSAAATITSQYAAMVFTAIATDYFPHLSRIVGDRNKTFILVNKQTDLIVLAVAPVTVLVIFLSPVIIRLLLTTDFLPTVRLVRWLALTTFIQACYFPLGYLPMAHGDKRLYFWLECVWTNIKTPLLMLIGYWFWGLWGLGYASVFNAAVDFVTTFFIMRWRYNTTISWRTTRVVTQLFVTVVACMAFSYITTLWLAYTLMSLTALLTAAYSVRELDRRLDLRQYLKRRIYRS